MALEKFAAEMVMGLASRGEKIGEVAMLGRQHLDLSDARWASEVETRLGYRMSDIITERDDQFAEPFFQSVGATSVDAIDFSPYQGANFIHDMNDPLPDSLKGRFQLLHDGGTMEHVFHVPNYLANCMKLLKVGGFYVGVVPTDLWMGHGFYQFSPELMFRVFSEPNGFRLRAHGLGVWGKKNRVFAMPDDKLWRGRMEPQFGNQTLLLIVAQKVADVEPFGQGWPQQSDYASRWAAHDAFAEAVKSTPTRKSWKKRLGSLLPEGWRKQIQWTLIQRRRQRERNALVKEVSGADQLLHD
jgi:hypothetical protein